MTARSILQVFDQYQKARIQFVQSVAEIALRAQNIDILEQAGVLRLLKPLLEDVCPQIQQCAAIALGRVANQSEKLSEMILNHNYLPILLRDINKQNKHYKRAALFALRSICKHNEEMASVLIHSGGLEATIVCMEDFEPTVKEGACWALGYIARHNRVLAQSVVDAGAIPLLILSLQEPEITLKQVAASALTDIAKHSLDLAQNVVDSGAIPHFARSLNSQDEKLKRQVLAAMSACAKHSTELAEVVVEAEVFPSVLIHVAHSCPIVRRNAAALVRDVVKHSLELTQLVVNTGGVGALMEAVQQQTGECLIPCITSLGYIAGHSDQLAMSVLACNGILELVNVLNDSDDDATLSVTVWALGQISKHSPEHANALAAANAFPRIINLYNSSSTSEDLKYKCKTTLKQSLQKCLLLSALEPLLYIAPTNILKYILGQFSKVLPNDPKARRLFVTSGGLKKIQEIDAEPGTTLQEYITVINACFPEEIVRYYSPGYPESLLEKVEEYSPQMMTILSEVQQNDSDLQTDIAVVLDKNSSPTHSQELKTLVGGDRA